MATKPQSVFSVTVNGAKLSGEKRLGKWKFDCTWDQVAERHQGDADLQGAMDDFMRLALTGVDAIKRGLLDRGRAESGH